MCQTTVERLFDRVWPSHIRKVASLFAQALSSRVQNFAGFALSCMRLESKNGEVALVSSGTSSYRNFCCGKVASE
jgi:hypothetical protein